MKTIITTEAREIPALNSNRLMSLPKISDVKKRFRVPFELQPKAKCVNCKNQLGGETEFCQSVKVCRACLSAYSVIDAAINHHAETKTRDAVNQRFIGKLK